MDFLHKHNRRNDVNMLNSFLGSRRNNGALWNSIHDRRPNLQSRSLAPGPSFARVQFWATVQSQSGAERPRLTKASRDCGLCPERLPLFSVVHGNSGEGVPAIGGPDAISLPGRLDSPAPSFIYCTCPPPRGMMLAL